MSDNVRSILWISMFVVAGIGFITYVIMRMRLKQIHRRYIAGETTQVVVPRPDHGVITLEAYRLSATVLSEIHVDLLLNTIYKNNYKKIRFYDNEDAYLIFEIYKRLGIKSCTTVNYLKETTAHQFENIFKTTIEDVISPTDENFYDLLYVETSIMSWLDNPNRFIPNSGATMILAACNWKIGRLIKRMLKSLRLQYVRIPTKRGNIFITFYDKVE